MIFESWDLVVVGAGPAGLSAARSAARHGISVLILEKNSRLGIKPCGEAISDSGLRSSGLDPSQDFIRCRISRAIVYAPDGYQIEIKEKGYSGYILDKPKFLEALASEAIQQGAEIRSSHELVDIISIDEGFLLKAICQGELIYLEARAVLGCDGVRSLIRSRFFGSPGYQTIPCLQYRMQHVDLEEDTVEFHLGSKIAPGGYAWIFPRGDSQANVGLGCFGSLRRYLDKFISRFPEKFGRSRIIQARAGLVPISGMVPKIVENGIGLCGDAAGQVMPLTGAGIHSSMEAGSIAGDVFGRMLSGDQLSLEEYPRGYSPWRLRMENSLRAMKILGKLKDHHLNQLARILDGKDIIDLANGLDPLRVGAKLMNSSLRQLGAEILSR